MPKKTIDIKAGRLFPRHFMVLAGIFIFAALLLVGDHPVIALVLGLLGLLIITAHEGTEINPFTRTYREYNSFMFLKTGKTERYSGIEGIHIHKAKISQKMFTARTMHSSTFTHIEYRAYLAINGGEKILLMRDKNKVRLLEKTRSIGQFLNTTVADHALMR